MRRKLLLLLLLLLSCPLLQSLDPPCPPPFSMQAGLCVFVSTAQNHTWCSANRQCASIGGELVNSYESIKLFRNGSIPSADCGSCSLWVGLSDLADERNRSRAGWQRVNGNGVFPEDASLFYQHTFEPSGNEQESCLRLFHGKMLSDRLCTISFGFACEFVGDARPPTAVFWKAAAFKRQQYNSDYCFDDVPNVSSAMRCTANAMRVFNGRAVLYNSKLKACRLLLFTDAQVEEKIETSADWIKFLLV